MLCLIRDNLVKKTKFTILASVIMGTVLEWYDFSLIASMAPIIGMLFFPSQIPALSLLATFGVFASGFLMRPLGGIIFGHIGDCYGRKTALSLTILLMALPTCFIGLLPNYHTIGVISPILLILLRLVQGMASSGEYPGAICFLAEMAPTGKRGLWGSLSMLGVVGGVTLGSLINAVLIFSLTREQMYSWGWRLPFLAGLPLGVIGWYLRFKVNETDIFSTAKLKKNIPQFPLRQIIKSNFPNLTKVIVLFSLSNVSFYLSFFYMTSFLVSTHKITHHQGLLSNTIGTFAMICLIPIFGYLSDKMNRKYIMLVGAACLMIFFYPIFTLFLTSDHQGILYCQLILALFIAMFTGPMAAATTEMFSTATRYSGVGVGLNIGASLFGGTSPFIATFLVRYSGNDVMPSFYLIIVAVVCLFTILFIKNNQHLSLDEISV